MSITNLVFKNGAFVPAITLQTVVRKIVESPTSTTSVDATKINGFPVSSATPNEGDIIAWNGSAYVPTAIEIPKPEEQVATIIDHDNIQNVGTNTHAQIDTHLANTDKHFTASSIKATQAEVDANTAGDKFVSPATLRIKRTGTATIVGDLTGNARGTEALDVQSGRTANTQVASEKWCSAVGYKNTASGYNCSAFGYENLADGNSATAVGFQNTSSGGYSVSFGYKNTTTSGNGVAIGCLNTTSGYYRGTAIGYQNTASANYDASAIGSQNTASGDYSSAFGRGNNSVGERSSAFGFQNTASSNYSCAIGYANTSSGHASSAFGYANTASGYKSVSLGYNNTASGYKSSSFGNSNTASGYYASAFGYQNNASGVYSNAIGYKNTASGNYCLTTGIKAKTTVNNTVEVGYWSSIVSRGGAVRMDSTGVVQFTIEDSATAPADGGSSTGGEVVGNLGRGMFTIHKNGTAMTLYYNNAGTIQSLSLGSLS